jgi:eukaryotic-like serine/threonine-protein kinase
MIPPCRRSLPTSDHPASPSEIRVLTRCQTGVRPAGDRQTPVVDRGRSFGCVVHERWGIVVDVGERQVLAGRYRLEDVLGRGGMSEVWRAFDLVLSRWVAVKLLSSTYAHNDHFREAIRTEAQTAAKVSHPHLAAVYDYGESVDEAGEPVPYVVMELLSGPTLARRLADRPLPPPQGAADLRRDRRRPHRGPHARVGPPGRQAEQHRADQHRSRADRLRRRHHRRRSGNQQPRRRHHGYTKLCRAGTATSRNRPTRLGCLLALAVLFRALTGELPWRAGTPTDTSRKHPAALPDLDGVPPQIGQLYLRCVDLDPDRRPAAHQVEPPRI